MDALNTCWDTLTYVDSHGPDTTAMGNIPFEYERVYPYKVGTDFQPMRMTLIVKNNEARVVFKSPDTDTLMDVNSVRRGNKFAGAWTKSLPESYVGGMVGVMTFAHQAAFTNMKITDLSKPVGAFCNGEKDVVCDAGKSGLCLAVPIADVCPDPVGANVIDTSSATSFDFVDDSGLSEACQWDITKDGRLSQVTNSHGYVFTLLGCNAIAKGEPYTDFIAQVSIENHDNDAVGMIFNWESEDRHCKVHACNDIWPSPAADNVEGPAFKIKCRNGNSCEAHPLNSTNNCYDTVAFVDRYGVYHGAMADGAVTPPVYSDAYIPYGYYSPTKMILMVRGQQMRAIFTPASGDRVVAAFSFQLPFNYDGGRVGL